MFTKTKRWISILIVFLLAILIMFFSLPAQASAQGSVPSNNTCLSCHENLYYLHDSGKSCCVTTHADHCAGCHEGNPTAMKKEDAHLGLILHPQENNGAKCLECHESSNVPTRLVTFKNDGGFDEVIHGEAYLPSNETIADFPETSKVNPLITHWKWLTGVSIAFGLWLVLVLFSPLKP